METQSTVFTKADNEGLPPMEGFHFVESTGQSLLVVGASRTGSLTANKLEALRRISAELTASGEATKLVFAPIPDITVSKYLQNLVNGLSPERQQSIVGEFLSSVDDSARYWNRRGMDVLTTKANDLELPVERWLSFWNSTASNSGLEEHLAGMYGSDEVVLPLSEHFSRSDLAMARQWIELNGGNGLNVDVLSPEETLRNITALKGQELDPSDQRVTIFDELQHDPALLLKTNLMGNALEKMVVELIDGTGVSEDLYAKFLQGLNLVKRSKDKSAILRDMDPALPVKLDEDFKSRIFEALTEAINYRVPNALKGSGHNAEGNPTLDVNHEVFWERVFTDWDFIVREVAAGLMLRYSQPDVILDHLKQVNRGRVTGPELYAYLLERSSKSEEVVLRQNFAGSDRGDAFPKALDIRNNWLNGHHLDTSCKVFNGMPLPEDQWGLGLKDKSPLLLLQN